MTTGQFGVELFEYVPGQSVIDDALLAERLGYDAVWLGDSQLLWREAWVLLGALAGQTSRVKLATGVTNPLTRHVTVTASAATTLQELSGGRVVLGVGAGFTAVRMLGEPPVPVVAMRRFIRDLRTLCAGEALDGKGPPLQLSFGAPAGPPPIVLAAAGPRMLHLAGAECDGVILQGRARADDSLRAMLAAVQEGRAAAGRADRPFRVCIGAAAAVHHDRREALAAVKSLVAVQLLNPQFPVSDAARAAQEAARAAYAHSDHMSPEGSRRLAAAIPDDAVAEFALAGTPAECVAQARALFAAGVDEITLRPYPVAGQSRAEIIEALTREVVHPALGR